jgi:hypothetical protein
MMKGKIVASRGSGRPPSGRREAHCVQGQNVSLPSSERDHRRHFAAYAIADDGKAVRVSTLISAPG